MADSTPILTSAPITPAQIQQWKASAPLLTPAQIQQWKASDREKLEEKSWGHKLMWEAVCAITGGRHTALRALGETLTAPPAPIGSSGQYRLYCKESFGVLCHVGHDGKRTVVQLLLFPSEPLEALVVDVKKVYGSSAHSFDAIAEVDITVGDSIAHVHSIILDRFKGPYTFGQNSLCLCIYIIQFWKASDLPLGEKSTNGTMRVIQVEQKQTMLIIQGYVLNHGSQRYKITAVMRNQGIAPCPGDVIFIRGAIVCYRKENLAEWVERPPNHMLHCPLPDVVNFQETRKFINLDGAVYHIPPWIAPGVLEMTRHECPLLKSPTEIMLCPHDIQQKSYKPGCVVIAPRVAPTFEFLTIRECIAATRVCKEWKREIWTNKFRCHLREIVIQSYLKREPAEERKKKEGKTRALIEQFSDGQLSRWMNSISIREKNGGEIKEERFATAAAWYKEELRTLWRFSRDQIRNLPFDLLGDGMEIWYTADLEKARAELPWLIMEDIDLTEEEQKRFRLLPNKVQWQMTLFVDHYSCHCTCHRPKSWTTRMWSPALKEQERSRKKTRAASKKE